MSLFLDKHILIYQPPLQTFSTDVDDDNFHDDVIYASLETNEHNLNVGFGRNLTDLFQTTNMSMDLPTITETKNIEIEEQKRKITIESQDTPRSQERTRNQSDSSEQIQRSEKRKRNCLSAARSRKKKRQYVNERIKNIFKLFESIEKQNPTFAHSLKPLIYEDWKVKFGKKSDLTNIKSRRERNRITAKTYRENSNNYQKYLENLCTKLMKSNDLPPSLEIFFQASKDDNRSQSTEENKHDFNDNGSDITRVFLEKKESKDWNSSPVPRSNVKSERVSGVKTIDRIERRKAKNRITAARSRERIKQSDNELSKRVFDLYEAKCGKQNPTITRPLTFYEWRRDFGEKNNFTNASDIAMKKRITAQTIRNNNNKYREYLNASFLNLSQT